jgi:hypothetical protein
MADDQDQLLPRQQLPSNPAAVGPMAKALMGALTPEYMQQPTGPIQFPSQPGKMPTVDPSEGAWPMAMIDAASMLPTGGGSALAGKGLGLAALHLLPFMGDDILEEAAPTAAKYFNSKQFHLVNDLGHAVGNAEFSYNPELKRIWIHGIESDEGPSSIGTADTRSLIAALRKEYPEAETVSGVRISGARKAGRVYRPSEEVTVKLPGEKK